MYKSALLIPFFLCVTGLNVGATDFSKLQKVYLSNGDVYYEETKNGMIKSWTVKPDGSITYHPPRQPPEDKLYPRGHLQEDFRPQAPFNQEPLVLLGPSFDLLICTNGRVGVQFKVANSSRCYEYDFHLELAFLDDKGQPIKDKDSNDQPLAISSPSF